MGGGKRVRKGGGRDGRREEGRESRHPAGSSRPKHQQADPPAAFRERSIELFSAAVPCRLRALV